MGLNKMARAPLLVSALGGATCAILGGSAQAAAEKANVPGPDKQFLEDTFSINEGEIMLGHLAEQRGTVRPVMDFAKRMISDHTKALYDDLSKKSGRDFDTAYLDAMVTGHDAAVREFASEAETGRNAAIKTYARDELPMLREHLSLARKAQQEEQTGVAEPQKP